MNKIWQTALNYLSRRDHTKKELTQKLLSKGFLAQDIHTVIHELIQKKWIDEKKFIENFIHWRQKKGYGPQRITAELIAKGIDSEEIAEQLNITDNAWLNEAQKLWQKHFKGKIATDYQIRAKQMRFLQYRGFTREQINVVLAVKAGTQFDET